jgi:hypothetical protein
LKSATMVAPSAPVVALLTLLVGIRLPQSVIVFIFEPSPAHFARKVPARLVNLATEGDVA